jgi:hypothetical protein
MRIAAIAGTLLLGLTLIGPVRAEEAVTPNFSDAPSKGAKECACQEKYMSPGKAGEYYHKAVRHYHEGELRDALIWARVALQYDPTHNRARKLKHELEAKGVSVIDD